MMAGFVTRLEQGQTLSAREHLQGSWREFSRISVADGSRRRFEGVDAEYAIFVVSGTGQAHVGPRAVSLTPGSAITVGYRASTEIEAQGGDIELFVTVLDVDRSATGASA